MLTERRDYILRLVQQAGATARRLRELLNGEGADLEGIVREADQAIGELLGGGGQAQLLERVDADTAARLLGDKERVSVWVELLELQADALEQHGAAERSRRVHGRASALSGAAQRLANSLGN